MAVTVKKQQKPVAAADDRQWYLLVSGIDDQHATSQDWTVHQSAEQPVSEMLWQACVQQHRQTTPACKH